VTCPITVVVADVDDAGDIIGVIEPGDVLDVVEGWEGDGTANVHIPCDSNGTGICYAEEGTLEIVELTATRSDIDGGSMAGAPVAGTVDARATRSGNEATAAYSFAVTLPG
jgi:hypothetical protein